MSQLVPNFLASDDAQVETETRLSVVAQFPAISTRCFKLGFHFWGLLFFLGSFWLMPPSHKTFAGRITKKLFSETSEQDKKFFFLHKNEKLIDVVVVDVDDVVVDVVAVDVFNVVVDVMHEAKATLNKL